MRLIHTSAVVLIVLTTVSIAVTVYLNEGPFWVGERSTHVYYDYQRCPELMKDPKSVVVFASRQEAIAKGYLEVEGCG